MYKYVSILKMATNYILCDVYKSTYLIQLHEGKLYMSLPFSSIMNFCSVMTSGQRKLMLAMPDAHCVIFAWVSGNETIKCLCKVYTCNYQ